MDEYDPYYFAINYGESESPPRPFVERLIDVKAAPAPSIPIYLEPVKQIVPEPAPIEIEVEAAPPSEASESVESVEPVEEVREEPWYFV